MHPSKETDPVVIKKYGNRRLYDTRQSRYITLEDLAGIIQAGATVRVVDAANGKDLTRAVLTQVILEQQDRLDILPVELLHTIIRTQGTLQQAPFAAFLSTAIRSFTSTGNLWAQQMATMFGGMPGFPGFSQQPPANSQPSASPGEAEQSGADASGQSGESAAPDELSKLRDRVESLLKNLSGDDKR